MKRSISHWQFFGFIFTGIVGVILHFLYEWTNNNKFVAIFSGINESTWEHIKLLFFPMFIFALIENKCFKKEYENFWCVKLKGILIGMILIPVLFYTLTGVFGQTPSWINITIFFIAAGISYIYETSLFNKENIFCVSNKTALFFIICIAFSFAIFTFAQPKLAIFKDPVTGAYGII